MRDEILKIIQDSNPRSTSKLIKSNHDIWHWVLQKTTDFEGSNSERIYLALNPESNICSQNHKKKFKSIRQGYGFCGKPSHCECAKQYISESVKSTHRKKDNKSKDITNKKRAQTNLERYGHVNVGQTESAIKKHQEFYSNENNIKQAKEKHVQTLKKRYGEDINNARDIEHVNEKIKQTNLIRYGFENPMQNPAVKQKNSKTRIENWDSEKLLRNNLDKIRKRLIEERGLNLKITDEEYYGVQSRPLWKFQCIECGHQFEKRYDHGSYPICKVCHPTEISYKSQEELSIYNYIKSIYSGPIISGDRSIINPYEIDILLPELKIGIEYCGLFWHSEISSGKGYRYHQNKMQLMNQKGYQLITIFADEYLDNSERLFSVLKTKLNQNKQSVFARKTIVSSITKDQANLFLEEHHLQGATAKSNINYGLFHQNELIAVMSFRRTNKNDYELSRFASSINVVGGASKLLKHFQKNHEYDCIVSFADRRWSQGDLYFKLGFDHVSDVPPMQYYVKEYRHKFTKRQLNKKRLINKGFDPNMTEWEILQSLGFDRIWDCGKMKFVLTKKKDGV